MSDNPMATSLLMALWLVCVCVGCSKVTVQKHQENDQRIKKIEHPQIYSGTPMNTQTL